MAVTTRRATLLSHEANFSDNADPANVITPITVDGSIEVAAVTEPWTLISSAVAASLFLACRHARRKARL